MRVYTHSFNPNSESGPNKFTRQLFNCLSRKHDVKVVDNQEMADIEFCLIQQDRHKVKPMVMRLDGIWFNSDQNYNQQNAPIKFSYQNADAVIFQSQFNKKLTEAWFGKHKNNHVIHNCTDIKIINDINAHYWDNKFGKDTEVWSCASNWRPHKRLRENVRYFIRFAPKNAVFAIAGSLPMDRAKEIMSYDRRIHLMGDLDYTSLLALYKRSSTFVHLSYLDHCPNVVVDAQAAGCKIICSSTGGTSEIVYNGKIVKETTWDFTPTRLYYPPKINFDNFTEIQKQYTKKEKPSIDSCANAYYKIMKETLNWD